MTSDYQSPIFLRIPQAPQKYDQASYNNILRVLEDNFNLLTAIGLLRGNGIFLVNAPQDGNGLRVGEVFVDGDGFLRVVKVNEAFSGSVAATGGVGTITATTP